MSDNRESKMRPILSLLMAAALAGCTPANTPTAVNTPATPAPVAPSSHANGVNDMKKVVEGIVYQVDPNEILVVAGHAPLKFKLSDSSKKLESKGRRMDKLERGDHIKVNIKFAQQSMDIESFELVATAEEEAKKAAEEAKKKGDPHAGATPAGGDPGKPNLTGPHGAPVQASPQPTPADTQATPKNPAQGQSPQELPKTKQPDKGE